MHMFSALRSLLELAWPPKDLYEPLVLAPFEGDTTDLTIIESFAHKYQGPHSFGVRVERPIPILVKSYDWGGRYQLTLTSRSGSKFIQECGAAPSPWWSGSTNGFSLFLYSVPKDLPLGEKVELKVRVLEPGTRISSIYGKASLYIQRWPFK